MFLFKYLAIHTWIVLKGFVFVVTYIPLELCFKWWAIPWYNHYVEWLWKNDPTRRMRVAIGSHEPKFIKYRTPDWVETTLPWVVIPLVLVPPLYGIFRLVKWWLF